MNFFKLYIGDYQRDTAHLSVTEHGAFMLMLQHYYATEKPLPVGKALHRMLRATDKAERAAIDAVASQFWRTTEAGLVNDRADEEITKAATQASTNRDTALAREAARKAAREQHEQSTNRATNDSTKPPPRARNHSHSQTEPTGSVGRARERALPCPPDVDPRVWGDWQALRAKKRAAVSETTVEEARKEAAKAGLSLDEFLRVWCMRGSQGLSADWLKPSESGQRKSDALMAGNIAAAQAFLEGVKQ